MKKLFITLLLLAVFAVPALAKEYRVIADLQFENENHAIAFINVIEQYKSNVRVADVLAGYVSFAKFLDVWDDEVTSKPQHTRFHVDMEGPQVTHVVEDTTASQARVNELQAKLDAYQAKIDAWQVIIDTKQAEIDAQNP